MSPIAKLIYHAILLIAGIIAFIFLLRWNWGVGLAIFIMMWANNISTKKD